MPNTGGPEEAKKRLLASVVHSQLHYAATVWPNALDNHAIQKKLSLAQKDIATK